MSPMLIFWNVLLIFHSPFQIKYLILIICWDCETLNNHYSVGSIVRKCFLYRFHVTLSFKSLLLWLVKGNYFRFLQLFTVCLHSSWVSFHSEESTQPFFPSTQNSPAFWQIFQFKYEQCQKNHSPLSGSVLIQFVYPKLIPHFIYPTIAYVKNEKASCCSLYNSLVPSLSIHNVETCNVSPELRMKPRIKQPSALHLVHFCPTWHCNCWPPKVSSRNVCLM